MTKAGINKSVSVLALFTPAGIAKALDIPESEGTRLIEATLAGQPESATGYDRCCALLKAAQDVLDGKTVDEVVIAQPRRLPPEELDERGAPIAPPAAQGDMLPDRPEQHGLSLHDAKEAREEETDAALGGHAPSTTVEKKKGGR